MAQHPRQPAQPAPIWNGVCLPTVRAFCVLWRHVCIRNFASAFCSYVINTHHSDSTPSLDALINDCPLVTEPPFITTSMCTQPTLHSLEVCRYQGACLWRCLGGLCSSSAGESTFRNSSASVFACASVCEAPAVQFLHTPSHHSYSSHSSSSVLDGSLIAGVGGPQIAEGPTGNLNQARDSGAAAGFQNRAIFLGGYICLKIIRSS